MANEEANTRSIKGHVADNPFAVRGIKNAPCWGIPLNLSGCRGSAKVSGGGIRRERRKESTSSPKRRRGKKFLYPKKEGFECISPNKKGVDLLSTKKRNMERDPSSASSR